MQLFKTQTNVNVLLFLCLLLPISVSSDDCIKYHFPFGKPIVSNTLLKYSLEQVCYPSHIIGFNKDTNTPQWVEYTINHQLAVEVKAANKKYPRYKYQFIVDENLNSSNQIKPTEYKGTNLDRGHLAPFSTVGTTSEDKKNLNKMSNIAPQNLNLNRGCWRSYEQKIFKYAQEDINASYTVTVGVFFEGDEEYLNSEKKVQKPSHFYMIVINNVSNVTTDVILFPNKGREGKSCIDEIYTNTSEKELEKRIGIDFYPKRF